MNKVEKKDDYLELYQNEKRLRTSIAKLTHEIKNPLSVCNGYLEIMKEEGKTKEKYLKIVREEIKRTLDVINDFSFFMKEKNLELNLLDLQTFIEDIIKTVKPLIEAENGKISSISTEKMYIQGDYKRLKQALINIIKNSIESKSTKPLKIMIKGISKKNYYQLTVKDNGCGMTREELSHIYDDYYTTKKIGTGLGIPYTQEIIQLHKGNIKYRSKKNIGTTVDIMLPKEKSPKTFNNNNY